jgi:hypothetical protein
MSGISLKGSAFNASEKSFLSLLLFLFFLIDILTRMYYDLRSSFSGCLNSDHLCNDPRLQPLLN